MEITLSLPVIVIIVVWVVTQIWAWTRDGSSGFFACSDRGFAVLCATLFDLLFTALVGGIWVW